jgi:hypothetical protein
MTVAAMRARDLVADRRTEGLPVAGVEHGHAVQYLDELPHLVQILLLEPGARSLAMSSSTIRASSSLIQPRLGQVQIQHDGVDHRVHCPLGDNEAAAGPPARPGDLLVSDKSHSFPEHRAVDPVPVQQLSLGTEDLADRPPERDHVLEDRVAGRPGRPCRPSSRSPP